MSKQDLVKQLLPDEQQVLADRINGDLLQQLQQAATELYNRASPRLAEMANVLSELTARANNGDQTARQSLSRFFEVFELAKTAASGITIPAPADIAHLLERPKAHK